MFWKILNTATGNLLNVLFSSFLRKCKEITTFARNILTIHNYEERGEKQIAALLERLESTLYSAQARNCYA